MLMYRFTGTTTLMQLIWTSINFIYRFWLLYVYIPRLKYFQHYLAQPEKERFNILTKNGNYRANEFPKNNPISIAKINQLDDSTWDFSYQRFFIDNDEQPDGWLVFFLVVFSAIVIQFILAVVQHICLKLSKNNTFFFKKYLRSIFNKASNYEHLVDETYHFLTLFNVQLIFNSCYQLGQIPYEADLEFHNVESKISNSEPANLHVQDDQKYDPSSGIIYDLTTSNLFSFNSILIIINHLSIFSLLWLPLIPEQSIYNKKFLVYNYLRFPILTASLLYVISFSVVNLYEVKAMIFVLFYFFFESVTFQHYKLKLIYKKFNDTLPGDGKNTSRNPISRERNEDLLSKRLGADFAGASENSSTNFKFYTRNTASFIPFLYKNSSLLRCLTNYKNFILNSDFCSDEGRLRFISSGFKWLDENIDSAWEEVKQMEETINLQDVTSVNFHQMKESNLKKLHQIKETILGYGKGPN